MSKRETHLNFGPGALSRLECLTCKETTLHKFNKCIHCGAEHKGAPVRSIDRWNGAQRSSR